MPPRLKTLAAALLIVAWPSFRPVSFAQTRAGTLALAGATIYPSPEQPAIRDGVVLMRDGRIAAVGRRDQITIPTGTEVLDCNGLTITAGFWNSHVHFGERKWERAEKLPAVEAVEQLRAMLTRYGFTRVFDTGSPLRNTLALRSSIAAGKVDGPEILTTGDILWPKGGVPAAPLMEALGFLTEPQREVATPEEAAARARELLDAGADGIKVYAATWSGQPVFMAQPVIAAVAADVLVHTAPNMESWNDSLVRRMVQRGMVLVPTLKLWKYETRSARLAFARPFADAGVEKLRAFVRGGGTVLFGTDVGYMLDYDPSEEYALMARAGMTFPQILASLTTNPARRFGLAQRSGRVAEGMDADLVVLEGDPARDVQALTRARYTVRQGRIIHRRESDTP